MKTVIRVLRSARKAIDGMKINQNEQKFGNHQPIFSIQVSHKLCEVEHLKLEKPDELRFQLDNEVDGY